MSHSQLWILSTENLITKLRLKLEPSENEFIGKACEELVRRSSAPVWLGASSRKAIVRSGGIALILSIIHLWENDESLPALLLKLLHLILREKGASVQLINSGGEQIIQRIINIHMGDKEVRADGRILLHALSSMKRNIARKETEFVRDSIIYGVPLDLIHNYQAQISKQEKNQVGIEDYHKVDPNDGRKSIQKLIEIMSENKQNEGIQEIALESILFLSKDANQSRYFCDSHGITVLVDVMSTHKNSTKIQWRGCVIVRTLCESDSAICSDLGRQGVCKPIMNVYTNKTSIIELKEEALWTIARLCHADYCIDEFEKLDLKLHLYEHWILTQSANNRVVMPLKLRQIYSKENLEKEIKAHGDVKPGNEKMNSALWKKPKKNNHATFGTIDDLFEEGEPGLI